MRFKILFSFLILNFLSHCGSSAGEFGWAVTRDQGKDILERELTQITEYKMMSEKLIFSPKDTIHYVYIISGNPLSGISSEDEIFVSLEKESLGYVEIDIKKKLVETSSNSLKDKFKNLEVGHYIMKIGINGELVDSVMFDVVPDEGYEIKDTVDEDEEKDDIIRFSK